MKREMLQLLLLVVLGSCLLTGCATRHAQGPAATTSGAQPVVVTPSGTVVVPEPAPPSQPGVAGPPATAGYVWRSGYWTFVDWRWVWIPGEWQAPPPTGTAWVPGHWRHTPQGWTWTPGYWG